MNTTWTTLLLTGLRGNGKTLKAVSMMDDFIQAGVPVFASNFKGLTLPGVQFLDDPKEWQSLPPGSVLFVDEAQRYWRSRRSGEPSPEVIAMETQRHDGVRIVLLTQQPTFLDKHVRGLVDSHLHLVRRSGLQASQVYNWERCKDEPETPANLDLADAAIWPFPIKYFGTYESAEVHTIKRKFPMRLKLIAVAALVVVALGAYAYHIIVSDKAEAAAVAGSSAAGDAPAADSATRARRGASYATPEAYLVAHQAMVPAFPGSAPVFHDRKVKSEPELFCMSSGTDGNSSCGCMTEQGTRYHLDKAECQYMARHGAPYNPYKAPERRNDRKREESRGDATGQAYAGTSADNAASSATVIESGQVSGYGDLSITNNPGSAP